MFVYLVFVISLLKGWRARGSKLLWAQSAMRWLTLLCGPILVAAFPRFDPSALLREVLVPADAGLGTVIYRLRASDTTFDYPLVFTLLGDTNHVEVKSLHCSRFNSVCQANVIVKKRLDAGRFYDFMVEVRSPKGESANLNCSFRATNATTPIEKIFPGAPTLLMISEGAKRNTDLGTVLAKGNPKRMKAVLLELWGSKEFGFRQKLITDRDAEGTILLLSPLDYETKTVHHLTILANDPWTDMQHDTRNIAGWPLLVAVLDEQDTPPVFTIAPPITVLNPSIVPGEVVLKVHAEDGDRGNPRKIFYYIPSTVPFKEYFNITPNTGEVILQQPISNIITASRNGQPIILTVVAEEERTHPNEPPAQQSSVRLALIPPGVTGGIPTFGSIEYNALLDENPSIGTTLDLVQAEVHTEIGDVITLQLDKCNGTFDVTPGVVEGYSKFSVKVHDPKLLDYEKWRSVSCYIVAREINNGNNTSRAKLTVHLNDVNDNAPEFTDVVYKGFVQENANIGTTVLRVEASDVDREPGNKIRYTGLTGSFLFALDPETGIISVANSQGLDAENTPVITLTVEAADEDGQGLKTTATVEITLVDINDQVPTFEKDFYEFILNEDQTAFTTNAFVKAIDNDISPPNNEIHYELPTPVDGLVINERTGELELTNRWKYNEPITVNIRAWDGGVPRLASEGKVKIYPTEANSRKMLFIVSGRNPDRRKVLDTLKALTGGKVEIHNVRPYTGFEEGATDVSRYDNEDDDPSRSVVEATVTNAGVIDVNRIKQILDNESTIKRTDSTNYKSETSTTTIKQSSGADLLWLLILLIVLAIIAAIILIFCCICRPCPFYIPPKRRKISTGDIQKLVKGSGNGRESKSVQVAEWFGRKEAWTPDQAMVDPEAESLRRHEIERGSERGEPKRLYRHNREVSRDQLYIREGNADILRLVTRGGEQQAQRPVAVVADHAYLADSGKEILMRRFIDQQQAEAARQQVLLPNAVTKLQNEHELLEASFRQQNALLRQIILDRERDLRLETQSLPAGTQTDIDAGTQTEPHFLTRKVRSDNDASDGSDDELTIIKSRIKAKNYRKSHIRRKIKTPILEESELEIIEKPQKVKTLKSSRPKIKQTKTSEMRQKRSSSTTSKRLTKSALRKEVLKEISKTLKRSDDSISDSDDSESETGKLSADSVEEISPRSDKTIDLEKKSKYAKLLATKTITKNRSISVDRHLGKRSLKNKRKKQLFDTATKRSESADRNKTEYMEKNRHQNRPESLDRYRQRRSTSRQSYQYYPDDRDSDYHDRYYRSPTRSYHHSPRSDRHRMDYEDLRRLDFKNDRHRINVKDPRRVDLKDRYYYYKDDFLDPAKYHRSLSRDCRRDRSHSRDMDQYHEDKKQFRSESLDREYHLSTLSHREESNMKNQQKFLSETDLRLPQSIIGRESRKTDSTETSANTKTKPKTNTKRTSRYMEWYNNKNKSKNSTKPNKIYDMNDMDPVKENNQVKETIKLSGSRLLEDTESSARKKVDSKKSTGGPDHPLLQHSEYRYEAPYLPGKKVEEDVDSGIALTKPSMAQKKSVFTIAYNEIHTSQIKDVTTPPPLPL